MRKIPTRERMLNGRKFVLVNDYAKIRGITRQRVWQQIKERYISPERYYLDEYSGLWWVCVD